jgi:3',5'-cyclic AMP phosphodiesterase CpdA
MIIGQLSDIHVNGTTQRRTRLVTALGAAAAAGVGHLVLTGDLTSRGTEAQVHELAAVLDRAWPAPRRATIIPGNHDEGQAFDRAIRSGSLMRFREDSLGAVDLGEVVIVPLDTRFERRAFLFRAMGRAGDKGLGGVRDAVGAHQGKTIVVAMHHGPQGHFGIDDLVDRRTFGELLAGAPNVHVLCGHDHRLLDRGRIHVAPSVAYHPEPLRTYSATREGLTVGIASKHPGFSLSLKQIANEVSGLGGLPLPIGRLIP